MGKKSAIVPPSSPAAAAAAPRQPIRRTEDRIGGKDAHLSFKVLPLKRHLNRFAQGGEDAAIFAAFVLHRVAERWLDKASERSADPGHIKGTAALIRAAHDDPFLSPLLFAVVGRGHTLTEDDEVVTKHLDSVASKREAKREAKKDGAAPKDGEDAPAPMDEDDEEKGTPAQAEDDEEE